MVIKDPNVKIKLETDWARFQELEPTCQKLDQGTCNRVYILIYVCVSHSLSLTPFPKNYYFLQQTTYTYTHTHIHIHTHVNIHTYTYTCISQGRTGSGEGQQGCRPEDIAGK